jgi:TonB family protein
MRVDEAVDHQERKRQMRKAKWLLATGALSGALGCGRSATVQTAPTLPLRRVVVYRNGVGYFERQGRVEDSEVHFRVLQREVGDFLATLAVMERGGSSVRAAAFPLPEERPESAPPPPDVRRTVRLSLDGREHDLVVGYTVETPIWRPSYRLVFDGERTEVQAWGIVQNLSGEDWRDVRLSLVAGAPVSFRSELARPVVPPRPVVTDQGTVIDAVPTGETTLAQGAEENPPPSAEPSSDSGDEAQDDPAPSGRFGLRGMGQGGGRTSASPLGEQTGSGQGYGSSAGHDRAERRSGVPPVRPVVRPTAASVQGALSRAEIHRVVQRHLGQLRFCHEQGLVQNPNATGRIVVRFVIGPAGVVTESTVTQSSHPVASVATCIADAVRRWRFPLPEGGTPVTVTYPFVFTTGNNAVRAQRDLLVITDGDERDAAPTSSPRNVAALAAMAVQGGATRYDLPQPVTIPDQSATMVMLAAREVPGRQMFLFAPDPGIPASSTHPFRVARFENRTGALLERGPIAIFEAGAYLGQGMLEPLPDGATTTIPFALDRALAVDSESGTAIEGARLVSMQREHLTLERFRVTRTTWRVRNGGDTVARVMLRQVLHGERLHEAPAGTEETHGAALVPVEVPARGRGEVLVTTRSPFTVQVTLSDEQALTAIEQYLREGAPAAPVAQSLREALDLRRQIETHERERSNFEERRNDLQREAEETRENLRAIQRTPQAADLRARLTARLGRVATELDQLTRRIVELDTQIGERRVRLAETVRDIDIDIDTSRRTTVTTSPRP